MEPIVKPIILGSLAGNCYLIKTSPGFILIDTGQKSRRKKLENKLNKEGCYPGNLNLIILTHGDFDHSGNCTYLRSKYRTKIAIHVNDAGMVEKGDIFFNRKKRNFFIRVFLNLFSGIEKFTPDLLIDEGFNLSEYGLNARIINLPGHSKGSLGILTANGDLFCGDLFINVRKPQLNSILDDYEDAHTSMNKLKNLYVNRVYPGHGKPFPMNFLR